MADKYKIRCEGHNYVTLTRNGAFLRCFDNDMMWAEEIILKIEAFTGKDFKDIEIDGKPEDFEGLRFFNGGWKRKFWVDFPTTPELTSFVKMRGGRA